MPHDGLLPSEGEDRASLMETAFIDGYRAASDKRVFLEMIGIPFAPTEGPLKGAKLVKIRFEESFEVGHATPAFGSDQLVYHPLPGGLISGKARLVFIYVDRKQAHEMSFAEVMALRDGIDLQDRTTAHDHAHHPHH